MRLLVLTLASVLFPAALGAQNLDKVPPPIEVQVAPGDNQAGFALPTTTQKTVYVVPGAPVRITGSSVPLGPAAANKQVAIEVRRPGAMQPTKLAGALDGTGKFSATFNDTSALGDYVVTAFTADGKSSATAAFRVISAEEMGDIIDQLTEAFEQLQEDSLKVLEGARTAVVSKGPFEGDAKVTQALQSVTDSLESYTAKLQQAKAALKPLGEVAKKYPAGAKHLEPLVNEMTTGIAEASARRNDLQRATMELSRNNGVCDRIDAVTEVLGAVSLYFDLTGRLFNKIVQLATDKYLPDRIYNDAVPVEKRDATAKFQLGETMKAVGAQLTDGAPGVKDFLVKPQNLLLDTTQYLTGLAFDKLCERFQGPVSGTFKVDATVNTQKFWGYTTNINGRIVLRYAKAQVKPGMAVEMTGEIEGNGDFSAYEDLMAFNSFNRQFVIYRQLFQPVGMGAKAQAVTDPLGQLARHATPAYFRIPVKGRLEGDTLSFTVADNAMVDFSDAVKARVLYVVFVSLVPQTLATSIPIQSAQFVLSRGVRTTAEMKVAPLTKGKQLFKIAEQAFTRKEVVSNGEVTVTWNLNVKACNPECP